MSIASPDRNILDRLLSFSSTMQWWCHGKGRSELEEVSFKHASGSIGINQVSDFAAGLLSAAIDERDRISCHSVQELSSVSEFAFQAEATRPAFLLGDVKRLTDLGAIASGIIVEIDRPVGVVIGLFSEIKLAINLDRFDSAVFAGALVKLEFALRVFLTGPLDDALRTDSIFLSSSFTSATSLSII